MSKINEGNLSEVIGQCDILPKRNALIITLNMYSPEESELEIMGDMDDLLDEWQYVVSAGKGALYKAGDKVLLDLDRMTKRVPDPHDNTRYIDKVNIKPIMIGEHTLTIVDDNYVLASKHEFEKAEDITA